MTDTLGLGALLPDSYEAPATSSPEGGEACLIGKAPIYPDGDCNGNGEGPSDNCNGQGCGPTD